MYEVSVKLQFCAAHRLEGYPGDCSRLHGHNWAAVVYVRALELDELGMVCDFRLIRSEAGRVLRELDHTLINDHPEFADQEPSSERLALWLFRRLRPRLDSGRYRLHAVEIWETDSSCARYERGDEIEQSGAEG